MNKIFIEAKNDKTPECHFLKAILATYFPNKVVEFIYMDGVANLFNETISNQISLAQESGEQVLVFVDADTADKGWGYEKRKADIERHILATSNSFPYFLYPHNCDDGDVEVLMEEVARRDLHSVFFDCFEDYEACISGAKDKSGQTKYKTPNRKGKLHTYITAQKLSKKGRNGLGSGDWLFNDKDYWDLDFEALRPLKDFLGVNLK